MLLRDETHQTFIIGDIGHSKFAVEPALSPGSEGLHGTPAVIRAVTAHETPRGVGKINHSRSQLSHQFPKSLVKTGGRSSFIAATEQCNAGVIPYSPHIVVRIFQEHLLIVGFRAVNGICKPEILPHHNTVSVAGLIEFLVSDLPHPVADNIEVLSRFQSDSHVVLPGPITQQGF